jgi:UDP-glucuronate decarboxylase
MDTPDDVTGPVNVGNPHEIPVRELAERIVRLTGSKSEIVYRPLPQDDPTQRCPDITLARKLMEWEPTVALDDGLQRTIAYFAALLARGGVEGIRPVTAVA